MNKQSFKHQIEKLLFIAVLLFSSLLSCSKNETATPDGLTNRTKNGITNGNQFRETTPNEHSISVEDAKAFIKSYYQQAVSNMSEEEKKLVATSVYFPLEALENYLAAMKQYNTKTSGLRVYFARYNKPHVNSLALNAETLALDHNGVNTVILVATEKDKDGYPLDIIGQGAYQPFNAGISCPPMPASYCKGLYCPLIED